jgi:hypothetical protein
MNLETVIFCEDIRHEINNKKTLVGIYADRIVLRTDSPEKIQFPIVIRLCCFCRFENEKNDPPVDSFDFSYVIPGQTIPALTGNLNRDAQHRYFTITVMGEGLPVNLGNIGYKISIKAGDKVVKEFMKEDALLIQMGPKDDLKK